MNKVEEVTFRKERYWYVFFLLIYLYHGQRLIEVVEGRAAHREGFTLDSIGVAGLEGSRLSEREGKPVVHWK